MRNDISCQLLSACVHMFEICLRRLWRVAKNKAANFQHKLHPDVLHARCQCNYTNYIYYLKFMEGLRTDHSNTSSVRCSLEAAGAKEDGCGLIWFHDVSCGLTWFVDVLLALLMVLWRDMASHPCGFPSCSASIFRRWIFLSRAVESPSTAPWATGLSRIKRGRERSRYFGANLKGS